MPRRFTPAQANRTLPLVRRIVEDILEAGKELRWRAAAKKPESDSHELERLGGRIRELLEELKQIGCDYKDWSFDVGLIDFPAVIDGKHVLLCWRSDEPAIAWYHGVDDGFAGRKRIPERLLQDETVGAASKSTD